MRPAIALLEFDSVAAGIEAGDAMVKAAPVGTLFAGTVHPGKYLVLVGGDVAAVEEARDTGRRVGARALRDELFLPEVDPQVVAALGGRRRVSTPEALGIVETRTVAALLGAADAGVKHAQVELLELRVADDLGGKAYLLFGGTVAEVEAGVGAAVAAVRDAETVIEHVVIPQLHPEMLENLAATPTFRRRVEGEGETAPGRPEGKGR